MMHPVLWPKVYTTAHLLSFIQVAQSRKNVYTKFPTAHKISNVCNRCMYDVVTTCTQNGPVSMLKSLFLAYLHKLLFLLVSPIWLKLMQMNIGSFMNLLLLNSLSELTINTPKHHRCVSFSTCIIYSIYFI